MLRVETDRLRSKLTTTHFRQPRRIDRTDSSLDELLFDSAFVSLPLERTVNGLRHVTLPVRAEDRRTAYLVHLVVADPESTASSLLMTTSAQKKEKEKENGGGAVGDPSSSPRLESSSVKNVELLHFREVLQHIYGRLYKRTNYEHLRREPSKSIDPKLLADLFVLETSCELKRQREKAAEAVREEGGGIHIVCFYAAFAVWRNGMVLK